MGLPLTMEGLLHNNVLRTKKSAVHFSVVLGFCRNRLTPNSSREQATEETSNETEA